LGLHSGIYDAVIATELSVKEAAESTGNEFDVIYLPEEVSEQIMPGKGYFVFSKDNQELADKFDVALRSMIDDGALRSIALDVLGVDFSR
jgi:ABC-type amino acid transport substrate-binding protein